MTPEERSRAIEKVLDTIPARLASGELNGAGRFYTDEELAAGAATGVERSAAKPEKASAA
jgi:hypothetical protein